MPGMKPGMTIECHCLSSSWPGEWREAPSSRLKARPSTSLLLKDLKTWMPVT
jgi:hypothetical protein